MYTLEFKLVMPNVQNQERRECDICGKSDESVEELKLIKKTDEFCTSYYNLFSKQENPNADQKTTDVQIENLIRDSPNITEATKQKDFINKK